MPGEFGPYEPLFYVALFLLPGIAIFFIIKEKAPAISQMSREEKIGYVLLNSFLVWGILLGALLIFFGNLDYLANQNNYLVVGASFAAITLGVGMYQAKESEKMGERMRKASIPRYVG